MSAADKLQRRFAFAAAAFSPYQHAHAVYVHELPMEQYAGCHPYLQQAAYYMARRICILRCFKNGYAAFFCTLQQYLGRVVIPCAYNAWGIKPHKMIHALSQFIFTKAVQIVHLGIAYQLYPLGSKLFIKTGKLQAGSAYLMGMERDAVLSRFQHLKAQLPAYIIYAYVYRFH